MLALRILEFILALAVVTEVLLPLVLGRPLFPSFRRRRQGKLLKDIEDARQDLDEDDIEETFDRLKAAHIERIKNKKKEEQE